MPSRAYRLRTKEDAADGVRRIAVGRAEKALERLGSAGEEDLAVAIHGARKELKKLRALLRLVRDELGKKTFGAEDRRYRDAGRLLSGSRDAEVKLETLLELRRGFEELPPGPAGRWEGMLGSEREEMAAAVREETGGKIAEVTATIEAGLEAIRQWPLRTDSWSLLGPGLARAYRDGRQAMKRALAEPSAENVHEWRKRAKDLWYQLRIVEEAWPELLGATVGQAHELTDLLGGHHDLAVLVEDLRSRVDLGDRGPFETAIAERQEELLDAAFGIGRRLYAEKPKAFRRRLERYWLAWRKR
ncbi:MAG TPA: CHAD domain-containing protein [Solirubrobacterales bacterium]